MFRSLIAMFAAALFLAPGCASSQMFPAPSLPLTGAEPFGCLQSGSWVGCTPASAATYRGLIQPTDAPYNCAGDGLTDDTTCLGSAITAAETAGYVLWLGPHKYLTAGGYTDVTGPLFAQGIGAGWTGAKASQIIAKNANTTLFTISNAGSYINNTYFKAHASASGALIVTTATSTSVHFDYDWLDSPCIGLDISGNTNYVVNTYISNVGGSGCGNIRIGHATTAAVTTDIYLVNVTNQGNLSNRPDYNLKLEDGGGAVLQGVQNLYGKIGTYICPGASQSVEWLTASDTAFADTTAGNGIKIDTCAASGTVAGLNFGNAWAAGDTVADEVLIQNTGGGNVFGIYFNNARILSPTGLTSNGIVIGSGVADVSVDSSRICGFNSDGIAIATGVGQVRIRNNDIYLICSGQSGTNGTTGVGLAGSNSEVAITGNDFGTLSAPIVGNPTGNAIVGQNIGVSTSSASVASASSITLANSLSSYLVTGNTGISTINGAWNGRTVTLITTGGAVAFTTGGNICANLTSTQNVPVIATYNAANSCWYLK